MKVVIGVDGSQGSLEAVRFVSRLLATDRDEVFLYYSPPEVSLRSDRTPDDGILARVKATLADAMLDKARVQLPTALDVRTKTIVGTQSPKHGLIVAADECRADLIAVAREAPVQ